jgi:uncharacterized cupin superfamily protein
MRNLHENRNLLCAALAGLLLLALASSAKVGRPPAPVHLRQQDLHWVPLPAFGGQEAIIHRSADGKRVAAAFRESGKSSFTYPFDEFLVVTSGSLTVHVHGGETFTLRQGDVAYFHQGTAVDFEFSNFYDVPLGDMSFWEARIPMERLSGQRRLHLWAIDEERLRAARFERKLEVP